MLSFPNWTNGTCYGSKSNATFIDCGSELLASVKLPQRVQPAAASDAVIFVIGIPHRKTEVLRDGAEVELVACAGEAAQAHAFETND
jgi:hypothetical protein